MELKHIKTTLPFTDEELDTYFDDIESYFFHVHLDNSKYGGRQLLTYIYNSGMKANIESDHFSEKLEELLIEYIKTSKLVNIQSLNDIWVTILLNRLGVQEYNGKDADYISFIRSFIEKHASIVDELLKDLTALKKFLMVTAISDEEDLPSEEKCTHAFNEIGQNIVSLRNSVLFWDFFAKLKDTDEYYYEEFVTNSFDGRKIAYFFFSEFNPLGLLYMASRAPKEVETLSE